MKRIYLMLSGLVAMTAVLSAQDKGYLTGSFESNDHFYVNDPANVPLTGGGTGGFDVDMVRFGERFGSNNYLKLDYYRSNFSAGLQLEAYAPALYGYPSDLNRFALSNLYVDWKDEGFQITAGTFYDQLGSGLLFRSWEDRALGINNSIMGARFAYNWDNKIAVKAFWGMPHLGMEFSDSQIRGADLSVSLADLIGMDSFVLSLEGSLLNKFEKVVSNTAVDNGAKNNTYGWSGRLNFDWSGFFLKGEYVDLGDRYVAHLNSVKKGNAQLVDLGYNGRGLGVTVTGRRLEYMNQFISATSDNPVANLISYIPAMCTQYTYMLTTLDPYSPIIGNGIGPSSGEIGGQIDAFYNFRRGTAIGGKRGMRIHANFSTYYTLSEEGAYKPGNLLFRDFSFDVEKQWTKEFKMVLLYSMQEKNHGDYGRYNTTWLSNIFVADLLYKWTPTFSTRLELQYLTTHESNKDWMAALLEINFAPHWSIWGSDMYNHGSTKKHYYNAGVSYTKGRTRVAAGYGRYKDGFICSGGVCRTIPQYTGANLSITTSF